MVAGRTEWQDPRDVPLYRQLSALYTHQTGLSTARLVALGPNAPRGRAALALLKESGCVRFYQRGGQWFAKLSPLGLDFCEERCIC